MKKGIKLSIISCLLLTSSVFALTAEEKVQIKLEKKQVKNEKMIEKKMAKESKKKNKYEDKLLISNLKEGILEEGLLCSNKAKDYKEAKECMDIMKKDLKDPKSTIDEIGDNTKVYDYTYVEDSQVNIGNPDRGFYEATYSLDEATDSDYNQFISAKEAGLSIVYARIFLNKYIEDKIPSYVISAIDKNLKDAKEAGIKIILRIQYREGEGDEKDATKERIEEHLDKLTTILQKNKDVISIVQAGIIGYSGEWHGFTKGGDFHRDTEGFKENRLAIIEHLNKIFPDKFIMIRTPMHKEIVLGDLVGSSRDYEEPTNAAVTTEEISYSDNLISKVGHYNDCFLSSDTDMGTYESADLDFWRDYVKEDSKYVPVGGETCEDDPIYTNCENALKDLKAYRWSFINMSYNQDVIQRWKDEGCYDEINENVGYKLVANDIHIEQSKEKVFITLNMSNNGFASPFIKYKVAYTLLNESSLKEYTYPVTMDIRKFKPKTQNSIDIEINTKEIPAGTYCVNLNIGEDINTLKLANEDIWDEELKTNKLICGVEIN